MKRFKYKAKRGPKETVEGLIAAETQDEAIDKINEMGLFPIVVDEAGISGSNASHLTKLIRGGRVKARDIVSFYRHLARLIKSGVPILKAISLLCDQIKDQRFKTVVENVQNSIRQGHTFSSALRAYPRLFPAFDIAMIQAGESSGTLEESLNKLVQYRDQINKLLSDVKSSLAYPAFICFAGLATMVFMLTYIVPRYVGFFKDLGQELPFLTRALIAVSTFMTQYGIFLLLFFVVTGIILSRVLTSSQNKKHFHRWLLRSPLLGLFLTKVEITRLARTLSLLLKSGIPVLNAVRIAMPVLGNEALKSDLMVSYQALESGQYLSEGLRGSKIVPELMIQLIALGEESGRLDETLDEIADWYEQDTKRAIDVSTKLLEPAVILAVGLILGLLIIAVLLPVFSMQGMIAS